MHGYCGYQWLCMVISGYMHGNLLSVVMSGYAWLAVVMHGYPWLSVVICMVIVVRLCMSYAWWLYVWLLWLGYAWVMHGGYMYGYCG